MYLHNILKCKLQSLLIEFFRFICIPIEDDGNERKLYDKNNYFTSILVYIIILIEILFLPPLDNFINKIFALSNIQYLKDNFLPYYISM